MKGVRYKDEELEHGLPSIQLLVEPPLFCELDIWIAPHPFPGVVIVS